MTTRESFRIAAACLVAASLAACAVAPAGEGDPRESTGTADQALIRCSAGYVAQWRAGSGPYGLPYQVCVPTVAALTGISPASARAALYGISSGCSTTTVQIPTGLQGANCSLGQQVGSSVIWVCPTGTTPPPPIGDVSVSSGACHGIATEWPDSTVYDVMPTDGGSQLGMTCEMVLPASRVWDDCVGAPLAGYEFIVDSAWTIQAVPLAHALPGGGGGCKGACASTVPAVSPP
jgi:hypothetical protein